MEGCLKNNGESRPQLMNLMRHRNREWLVKREDESSDENTLELRLGLPGDEDWTMKNKNSTRNNNKNGEREKTESILSLGCLSSEMKPFAAETAVPNSSQKRAAPGPVVGWPPIRSFRKNLASTSSSKLATESSQSKGSNEKPIEANRKGLFVKINMDGVPIGRKVDLTAYDSYEKLSAAVDELFRGLLAAQRDLCAGGIMKDQEEEKPITGLLDGNGEYTLVYEDNEGDRILVGDVPWLMFVSTVKRLRVLKSSELAALSRGSSDQGKTLNPLI